MSGTETVMPIILLGMSFLLKMSIDREVDMPSMVYAALELPVDVLFLAASFMAAISISKQPTTELGPIYFAGYIVLIALSIIIWRKSIKLFENENWILLVLMVFINFAITSSALVRSIQLV